MTSLHPTSDPIRPAPRSRRARAMVMLLVGVLALTLQGCSLMSIFHAIPFLGSRHPKGARPAASKAKAAPVADASSPDHPYEWVRVAQKRQRADSLESAEAALRSALALNRSYAPALAMLSKLYYESGRSEQGVQLIESARNRASEFEGGFPPELTAGLALHYDALGRQDDARRTLQSIGGNGARDLGGAWSFVLLRSATPDSASGPATAAVREHPRSAVDQNNYGITRLRAGDLEAARTAFRRAIDLDSKLAGPYYNLTILEKFYALDDAAAARWFQAYRERSHDDPDSLFAALGRAPARDLAGKDD